MNNKLMELVRMEYKRLKSYGYEFYDIEEDSFEAFPDLRSEEGTEELFNKYKHEIINYYLGNFEYNHHCVNLYDITRAVIEDMLSNLLEE